MKIRIIIILIALVSSTSKTQSQGFEWIQSALASYGMNPEYPEFPVCYNAVTGQVIHSRFIDYTMLYGQDVLATNFIEGRDSLGNVIWSNVIGDSAMVQRIITDNQGNIYVAGIFQETLHINGTDSLMYIQSFVAQNTFILKLDGQGNLLWKKNVTVNWQMYEGIEALAIDPSGKCWYAMTDYFIAKIVQLDNSGNDVTIHTISNAKRIGNVCFDPWGGMFISGAATTGDFIMDADTFNCPYQYSMFISRYDPLGNGVWAHFGYDITFQRPMISSDASGNVFFAGLRYDTTSFNGTSFIHPYLFEDFFAFKMDTSGTVAWGMQQPAFGIGPYGSFTPGTNLITAADTSGKFYLAGIHQGNVDWGGGFTLTTPSPMDRKMAVVCIDSSGVVLWEKLGGGFSNNYIHALAVTPGGTCYFTGSFRDTATFDSIEVFTTNTFNFCLGKINPLLYLSVDELPEEEVLLYPNPSSGLIHIDGITEPVVMEIYNASGQLVMLDKNFRDRELNLQNFPPGLYHMQFRSPDQIFYSRVSIME